MSLAIPNPLETAIFKLQLRVQELEILLNQTLADRNRYIQFFGLTKTEAKVLGLLMSQPWVSSDTLRTLWATRNINDAQHATRQYILNLRRKNIPILTHHGGWMIKQEDKRRIENKGVENPVRPTMQPTLCHSTQTCLDNPTHPTIYSHSLKEPIP